MHAYISTEIAWDPEIGKNVCSVACDARYHMLALDSSCSYNTPTIHELNTKEQLSRLWKSNYGRGMEVCVLFCPILFVKLCQVERSNTNTNSVHLHSVKSIFLMMIELWIRLFQQGTDAIYNPYDQFQSGRRTGIHLQPSRFKVWISVIKFDLAPKFGLVDETPGGHGLGLGNVGLLGSTGKASRKDIPEECDGMLRIWDGPLREPPICKDLNW